jgi:hypothetical protein
MACGVTRKNVVPRGAVPVAGRDHGVHRLPPVADQGGGGNLACGGFRFRAGLASMSSAAVVWLFLVALGGVLIPSGQLHNTSVRLGLIMSRASRLEIGLLAMVRLTPVRFLPDAACGGRIEREPRTHYWVWTQSCGLRYPPALWPAGFPPTR